MRARHFVLTGLLLSLVSALAPSARAAETTAIYPVAATCGDFGCPDQSFTLVTDGVLRAAITVDPSSCRTFVDFKVDGTPHDPALTAPVASGGSTGVVDLGPVTAGPHGLTVVSALADGIYCDSKFWSGTLSVTSSTSSDVSKADSKLVFSGADANVSTLVDGSPRPAGITATLYHAVTASLTPARISVATYAALPSALSRPPTGAAGYLDLQLTDGDAGDTIAAYFYPVDPIIPSDPHIPPNPVIPGDPHIPPNPVRLAYWDGVARAWSPVKVSSGVPGNPVLPAYDSFENRFSVTFSANSTPSVIALTGTVFAVVPSYYFRGFGIPLDPGVMNVAKAGRAIPLKWQVYDYVVEPVLDLDPAIVKLSSVVIPCEGSGEPTDALGEYEYATGASGLQNLGDGSYQLNWGTSRAYAGTCRRVRLDLGEQNPDGTPFYRTAKFHFAK